MNFVHSFFSLRFKYNCLILCSLYCIGYKQRWFKIGLRFSSSLYGQPLYLRIDRVLDAKINEKEPIGKADWVFSFQKIIN